MRGPGLANMHVHTALVGKEGVPLGSCITHPTAPAGWFATRIIYVFAIILRQTTAGPVQMKAMVGLCPSWLPLLKVGC